MEELVCPHCLNVGEIFVIFDEDEGDGYWITCHHESFDLEPMEVGNSE